MKDEWTKGGESSTADTLLKRQSVSQRLPRTFSSEPLLSDYERTFAVIIKDEKIYKNSLD
jgi:hypothetical protein